MSSQYYLTIIEKTNPGCIYSPFFSESLHINYRNPVDLFSLVIIFVIEMIACVSNVVFT